MEISITKLPPESWQAYRDIRLKAIQCDPQAFAETLSQTLARPEEEWKSYIQNMWFVLAGQNIIGMIGLLKETHDRANIISLWVDPEHRGKKIGTKLIQYVLAYAQDIGIKTLNLTVTTTQKAAIQVYMSLGFTIVAGHEKAICRDDAYFDQYLMEKRL